MERALSAWLAVACGACSADTEDLLLPVPTQSEPAQPTDIVVTLRHEPPSDVACVNDACSMLEHWVVDARCAIPGTVLHEPRRYRASQLSELQLLLKSDAAKAPPQAGDPRASTATVSIRAPADTPLDAVVEVITALGQAWMSQLEFAVQREARGGVVECVRVPLPGDRGGSLLPAMANAWVVAAITAAGERHYVFDDQRLAARERSDADARAAAVGWRREPRADRPRRPSLAPGDPIVGQHALQRFLREWRETTERQRDFAGVEGVVDGDVPLQAAIELIDAFHAAGIRSVSFAASQARAERRGERK